VGLVGKVAEDAVETVRVLVLEAFRSQAGRIVLFGSRATGSGHAHSDIDVGILPRGALDRRMLTLLRERLEEHNLPYEVDMVDLSQTSEAFRCTALKGAIEWRS